VFGGVVVMVRWASRSPDLAQLMVRSMSATSGGHGKSFVFGAIVAGLGCLRGMQTKEGPNAVGDSTTRRCVAGS
jgi:phospholipid/cholesterol/gamma-HCH transport system permease protein